MNHTRLSRKGRTPEDLGILSYGNLFDAFDNAFKESLRLNDEEYNYITEHMSDEELDTITNDSPNFAEKKKILSSLQKHLIIYYKN